MPGLPWELYDRILNASRNEGGIYIFAKIDEFKYNGERFFRWRYDQDDDTLRFDLRNDFRRHRFSVVLSMQQITVMLKGTTRAATWHAWYQDGIEYISIDANGLEFTIGITFDIMD